MVEVPSLKGEEETVATQTSIKRAFRNPDSQSCPELKLLPLHAKTVPLFPWKISLALSILSREENSGSRAF